jgi:hypothetical protein
VEGSTIEIDKMSHATENELSPSLRKDISKVDANLAFSIGLWMKKHGKVSEDPPKQRWYNVSHSVA